MISSDFLSRLVMDNMESNCDWCRQSFPTKKDLSAHLVDFHRVQAPQMPPSLDPSMGAMYQPAAIPNPGMQVPLWNGYTGYQAPHDTSRGLVFPLYSILNMMSQQQRFLCDPNSTVSSSALNSPGTSSQTDSGCNYSGPSQACPPISMDQSTDRVASDTSPTEAESSSSATCSCGESGPCSSDYELNVDDSANFACDFQGCDYSTGTQKGLNIHRKKMHQISGPNTRPRRHNRSKACTKKPVWQDVPCIQELLRYIEAIQNQSAQTKNPSQNPADQMKLDFGQGYHALEPRTQCKNNCTGLIGHELLCDIIKSRLNQDTAIVETMNRLPGTSKQNEMAPLNPNSLRDLHDKRLHFTVKDGQYYIGELPFSNSVQPTTSLIQPGSSQQQPINRPLDMAAQEPVPSSTR